MSENCPVDFWTHYSYLCLKSKVCPLRSVIKNLKGKELCFSVENIRREHWPFLLSALSVDQSLTKVWFWSNFPIAEYKEMSEKKKKKNVFFPIPYGCTAKNITDICKCVSHLLQNSKALKVLMIGNLFLRNEDIQNLTEGLKNSNIDTFSLSGCQLQDEYVEALCRGLQSSTVSWIDFSMCGLSISGLTFICDLIKAHHLKRSNDMFPETLRYRLPILDDMKGLRRISLNNNDFGDRGVEILMDSLQEDIWMKALDLQKCCIENEGARSILKILRSNVGLQLLDLRQNKIDTALIDRIALQLSLNNAQKEIKYELGDLWKPLKYEKAVRLRIAKTKNAKLAVSSKPGSFISQEKKLKVRMGFLKEIEKTHIGGDTVKKHVQSNDASSQTTFDFNDEFTEMKNALLHEMRVQNSLKQLVKKYKLENSLLRKELDKMAVLENYILIDHETFVEITNIFEKFKKFLEAMKKYGLWECIEMLGVSEKSDIALKPFIIDTTRKCMQLVESDSPSDKKGDSIQSSNPSARKHISTEQSNKYYHHYENKSDVNEFQEKAHNISKQIQEQIFAKARPQMQNKVMKVFMDVRDNYSKSILSSQASDGRKADHIQRLEDYYKQSKSLQQMHHSKSNQPNSENLVSRKQRPSNKKSVGSQTPSVEATGYKQKSSSTSHKIQRRKISTPNTIQSSSSVTDISSDEPSPVYEHSIHESHKSSEYKSLPTPKSMSVKENSRKSEFSKSFKRPQASGDHVLKHSLHSERALSSDSESTLRSSKISVEKLPSDKSNHYGEPQSRVSGKARTGEHVASHKTSTKSSSTVSSVSSYNSRKEVKSDSSGGKGDSNKSYLESVSDGSTDKDVKSLSLSEVYSSVGDKRDPDHSNQPTHLKPKELPLEKAPLKDKTDSIHSNQSTHSSKPKESPLEKVPLKDITSSSTYKEKEVPLAKAPSLDEKLSQVSKDPIHESSPKSSRTKDSQQKLVPPHDEKPLKRNNSESSIPSLSDITTVSSHSLNTDSVMGQLSDI